MGTMIRVAAVEAMKKLGKVTAVKVAMRMEIPCLVHGVVCVTLDYHKLVIFLPAI